MKNRFLFYLLLVMVVACTPKVQEVVTEKEDIKESTETIERPTACTMLSDLNPADKEKTENAFVLYRDEMRRGNAGSAMRYWKIAYYNAPGSNGSVKSHFSDGVRLYGDLIRNTEDSVMQNMYIDTIMSIFEKRVECFGEDANFYAQKGFDLYYNMSGLVDERTIYETFKKSIDMSEYKIEFFLINPFVKTLYDMTVEGKLEHPEASRYAVKMIKAIERGLAECEGKDCEAWEIIASYSPDRLEALEALDGFYDCEYYTEKYYTLQQQSPEDCELVKLAYARMLRGGCDEAHPPLVQMQEFMAGPCYEAPPSLGPCREGIRAYNSGEYRKAVELLQECAEVTEDKERKAYYLMLISKVYYRDLKNYPASRRYALEAAQLRPNWGEPYMIIGRLYASSGPICGPGTGFDSQIVTWPAIDKFEHAKRIDPSVRAEADKMINTYKKYMPSYEDVFQRNMNLGDEFFVGCWIQEKTTIRVP
jgi:tetratricopeptide (TPR) repeat protein